MRTIKSFRPELIYVALLCIFLFLLALSTVYYMAFYNTTLPKAELIHLKTGQIRFDATYPIVISNESPETDVAVKTSASLFAEIAGMPRETSFWDTEMPVSIIPVNTDDAYEAQITGVEQRNGNTCVSLQFDNLGNSVAFEEATMSVRVVSMQADTILPSSCVQPLEGGGAYLFYAEKEKGPWGDVFRVKKMSVMVWPIGVNADEVIIFAEFAELNDKAILFHADDEIWLEANQEVKLIKKSEQ